MGVHALVDLMHVVMRTSWTPSPTHTVTDPSDYVVSLSWSPPGTRRALLVSLSSGANSVWMQVSGC